MPTKLQSSFIELGAAFDIDPDFNMLNDVNIAEKSYYAPEKFVVLDEVAIEQEALDAEEAELEGLRDDYDEGFEDFEDDTAERTGTS